MNDEVRGAIFDFMVDRSALGFSDYTPA